jgi:hypothetical protein
VILKLQRSLENYYELPSGPSLEQFLIDESMRAKLQSHAPQSSPEQLLVRQGAGGIEMALFIAPSLLAKLQHDDPEMELHTGNLAAFLSAAEGVSHALALSYCAELEREISALELETQGEIDKFVLCAKLASKQGLDVGRVFDALFEDTSFLGNLSDAELDRYRFAHRTAARLLRRLLARYSDQVASPHWQRLLRRFYRAAMSEKLRIADG